MKNLPLLLYSCLTLQIQNVCSIFYHNCYNCQSGETSDYKLEVVNLIKSRGLSGESHSVVTGDGYVLNMFRIWDPLLSANTKLKPILLMHGIMSSSFYYLYNADEHDNHSGSAHARNSNDEKVAYRELNGKLVPIGASLPNVLAKFGYDVWLGNFRGNKYSANHTLYSQRDALYWAYTLDELINFDLTAMISYILAHSKSDTIGYIGHSMGTSAMFGLLSSRVEYNRIVNPFIALAPVVYISHNRYFRQIATLLPIVRSRPGLIFGRNQILSQTFGSFCDRFSQICSLIINLLFGYNPSQLDKSRLGPLGANFLESLPNYLVSHFMQMVQSGRFERFDYDQQTNAKIYGQSRPPEYDVSRITTNVAIFYSYSDHYINRIDMSLLKSKLKDVTRVDYEIPDPKWTHMDYHLAKDSGFYVNSKIIDVLRVTDGRDEQKTL